MYIFKKNMLNIIYMLNVMQYIKYCIFIYNINYINIYMLIHEYILYMCVFFYIYIYIYIYTVLTHKHTYIMYTITCILDAINRD